MSPGGETNARGRSSETQFIVLGSRTSHAVDCEFVHSLLHRTKKGVSSIMYYFLANFTFVEVYVSVRTNPWLDG